MIWNNLNTYIFVLKSRHIVVEEIKSLNPPELYPSLFLNVIRNRVPFLAICLLAAPWFVRLIFLLRKWWKPSRSNPPKRPDLKTEKFDSFGLFGKTELWLTPQSQRLRLKHHLQRFKIYDEKLPQDGSCHGKKKHFIREKSQSENGFGLRSAA